MATTVSLTEGDCITDGQRLFEVVSADDPVSIRDCMRGREYLTIAADLIGEKITNETPWRVVIASPT